MKIERLRNKKSKLIFLCGFLLVVILLITLVFKGSKAKYRNSNIIPLINTKVKNNVPDFTVMGIYLNDGGPITGKDGKKYTKQEDTYTMPSSGYIINETNSYCTLFNKDTNTSEEVTKADNPELQLYTDVLGSHSIKGVKKGYKCHLFFDEGTNKFISVKSYLLNMWGYEDISKITERPETDFTGTTKVTISGRDTTNNRDWLYKAPDDDGISYYLAGSPKYNWVKFGGYYWRIVRINGDGSVRMIYSGTGAPAEEGAGTQIENIRYNPASALEAIYVGYWYKDGVRNGYDKPSTIYTKVNNFYENNLRKYDSYIDKNVGFCNDRTLATNNPEGSTGVGTTLTLFAPRERLLSGLKPILTCPDKANDLFTTKIGKENGKGNGVLGNPIGLLTVDEAILAGLIYYAHGKNTNNYLCTKMFYWTISPYAMSGSQASIWYVASAGDTDGTYVSQQYGIRPVINLVKNITFSKGNGTKEFPFEI